MIAPTTPDMVHARTDAADVLRSTAESNTSPRAGDVFGLPPEPRYDGPICADGREYFHEHVDGLEPRWVERVPRREGGLRYVMAPRVTWPILDLVESLAGDLAGAIACGYAEGKVFP